MSEYSGIRGTRVKYLASDPTLNSSTEGQVWYNSTSGTLKSLVQIKAWSSGGNLPSARSSLASLGTQTAALGAGGYAPSPVQTSTVEYNGFAWTAGGSLSTARETVVGAGFGIQTAGAVAGGNSPGGGTLSNTEEYNGTAWTAGGSLGNARYATGSAGTQIGPL